MMWRRAHSTATCGSRLSPGGRTTCRAAGFGATTGRYTLLFDDDVPNDFANASLITVDSKLLSATQFGVIEVPTDIDVYRFVAPVTGPISVTQRASGGSLLDSYLFLYDDSQTLLGSNDDETINPTGIGGGLTIPDSLVHANVVAGRTYYIRAASATARSTDPGRAATGEYRLQLTFPAFDFGATFADARTILAPSTAVAAQQGNILEIGEVDMFQFAGDASGRVTIDFVPPAGLGAVLNPVLVAYDGSGNEIARGLRTLTIGVQEGLLYFIQAGGYGVSTGRFQLDDSLIPGSDRGLDFSSAIPVGLDSSGSASVRGIMGPAGSVNIYQFQAVVSGQTTVSLDDYSPGILEAFTVSHGTPTQVGRESTLRGVMTFDVSKGQIYFVRVTSTGFGGLFSLVLQSTDATAPPEDIEFQGKSTLSTLGDVFVATVSAAGPTPSEQKNAADTITRELVRAFLASQAAPLESSYLLVWTDPVDFVLTDANARQSGYTAGRGPISEVGGSYNSGGGVLKLVIVPLLSSSYELDLIGVGENSVLFGAAAISAAGVQVEAEARAAPELPISFQTVTDLVVVLGFNSSPLSPPPFTPNVETSAAPNPSTNASTPSSATTSGSSFLGALILSQATMTIAEFGGGSGASLASVSLAASASNVTSVIAPPSSTLSSLAEHSRDEIAPPAPPNPLGQDAPGIAIALAARLANGDFQGLSPKMQTIVQPIVRGLDSLGSRLWTIFKSVISNLSRPRVAGKRATVKGALFDPPDARPRDFAFAVTPARGNSLDPVLENHRQDAQPILIRESDESRINANGYVQRGAVVFALVVSSLGELRPRQAAAGRTGRLRPGAWRNAKRLRCPMDR